MFNFKDSFLNIPFFSFLFPGEQDDIDSGIDSHIEPGAGKCRSLPNETRKYLYRSISFSKLPVLPLFAFCQPPHLEPRENVYPESFTFDKLHTISAWCIRHRYPAAAAMQKATAPTKLTVDRVDCSYNFPFFLRNFHTDCLRTRAPLACKWAGRPKTLHHHHPRPEWSGCAHGLPTTRLPGTDLTQCYRFFQSEHKRRPGGCVLETVYTRCAVVASAWTRFSL